MRGSGVVVVGGWGSIMVNGHVTSRYTEPLFPSGIARVGEPGWNLESRSFRFDRFLELE